MLKGAGMTQAEYLEFEKNSDVRHEFANGAMHAMADDKKQNNRVVRRLVRLIDMPSEAKGCDVFLPWSKCESQMENTVTQTWL